MAKRFIFGIRNGTSSGRVRYVVLPDYRDADDDGAPDTTLLAKLPEEPFILFVGALRAIKGLAPLITAYQGLTAPPPLVLIGTRAPDTPTDLPDGVTVLSSVPHATVMAAWDRALFGVAPSILPEPLGNVVHEAMSRGKPVIGTRPGGHADMMRDGISGILVPSGDSDALRRAMDRLITNPSERDRMGRAARADAARFTKDAVLPDLTSFVRDAVMTATTSQG